MSRLTRSGSAPPRVPARTGVRDGGADLVPSTSMARATADLGKLDHLVDRGLAAIDAGEVDTAETLLDDARGMVGENHVRVLHLAGMLGWAHGDLERATGFLMQAADLKPERADIYLDCAECLFAGDEIEEAE